MNDETRKLYAAIGRGETVQYLQDELSQRWIGWAQQQGMVLSDPCYRWRIKPREILVNGVRVPAPLSELPEGMNMVYAPDPLSNNFVDDWHVSCPGGRIAIERGLAHATKEAAIAHAKAMLIRVQA